MFEVMTILGVVGCIVSAIVLLIALRQQKRLLWEAALEEYEALDVSDEERASLPPDYS
ncbi:hypothetical protein [Brevundimonas aurantiaca]|jgi:beta-lactamase regulating signal transducer with metallopeptidase domain|uniref:hypothetical protein n=1 Tax=Brevundimonas aurantiaca TaxID=74316 RepID=UPI001748A7CC|nr:hypothetical protein [Brevundimonas aurantiaca]